MWGYTQTMKNTIIILVIVALFGGAFIYGNKKNTALVQEVASVDTTAEPATPVVTGDTLTSGSYTIDTATSKTTWSGKKTLKENWVDTGSISIKSGNFEIKDGTFSSGKMTFDMQGITVLNTGAGEKGIPTLEKHLKSKDFFKVETFPTAEFTVKRGDSSSITGDLTILDVTKEITVPVTVSQMDGKVRIVGQTKIDRTQFGIKYGSSTFFDDLKDNVIANDFFLDFDIVTQ